MIKRKIFGKSGLWLISLPISVKHDGSTSQLGLFDRSLSGQTFLFADHAD